MQLAQYTYQDFYRITFPVYRIPANAHSTAEGIIYNIQGQIVDNRNLPLETLGRRRLHIENPAPLKQMFMDYPALLKARKLSHNRFIDSKGGLFTYRRTRLAIVNTHPVSSIDRKISASVIKVRGIHQPFIHASPPIEDPEFAQVVFLDQIPWIIYSFSSLPEQSFKVKV